MFAAPAEGTLKDFMEFGDTGCADHEQSPPHQRTHAGEHYAKLIDRNGRYGRFTHANSLSKRQPNAPFPVAARPLGISRNGGNQTLCKGPGACRPTGTFLVTVP